MAVDRTDPRSLSGLLSISRPAAAITSRASFKTSVLASVMSGRMASFGLVSAAVFFISSYSDFTSRVGSER